MSLFLALSLIFYSIINFQYLRASSEARYKAYCVESDVQFGIGHGGENGVKRHTERDCHRTKASALSRMSGGIARYVAAGNEVDRATAAETIFANFIAKSNLPLAITDDFSKMVGKTFPDSDIAITFSARRTKTTDYQGGACSRL